MFEHIDHVDRDSLLSSAPHGSKVFQTGQWVFDPSRTIARVTARTVFGRRMYVDLNVRSEEPVVVDDEGHLRHVNLSLVTVTVSSGSARRDKRLRSPAFLDADAFPTIGFVGRGKNDVVSGILCAKGKPSSVTVVATNATVQADDTLEFSVGGKIEAKSLGLGKLATFMVGQYATFQMSGIGLRA